MSFLLRLGIRPVKPMGIIATSLSGGRLTDIRIILTGLVAAMRSDFTGQRDWGIGYSRAHDEDEVFAGILSARRRDFTYGLVKADCSSLDAHG